jgi:hypothetical protein
MYQYTGDKRYAQRANDIAHYILSHPSLPKVCTRACMRACVHVCMFILRNTISKLTAINTHTHTHTPTHTLTHALTRALGLGAVLRLRLLRQTGGGLLFSFLLF